MNVPVWVLEHRAELEARGLDRGTAAWWAAWRDLHFERFPDSDERTKDNLRLLAASAAAAEGVLDFGEATA